jgi:hypothetical protein
MIIDLSTVISNVNQTSNIILVNPQVNVGITPQLVTGLVGSGANSLNLPPARSFLFHIPGEESVTLTSDVTDHFVEDNTALQDHVALKPISVTTAGYIGELNNVPPEALAPLKAIAERLTLLAPFLPVLSAAALINYNTVAQAYATAVLAKQSAVSAWQSLTGQLPTQNQQQMAYQMFQGYWQQRQLFTIQTPWAIFNDMIIMSLTATQDEDTRVISDFKVTFKKMRFAQTVLAIKPVTQGRRSAQGSSIVQNGTLKPTTEIPFSAATSSITA